MLFLTTRHCSALFEDIVLHPERIPAQSRASRDFVATHNHLDVVSRRFLDFWARDCLSLRSNIC